MKVFVVFPGWQFYRFEPVCQLWIRSQGSFRNVQVYPHLSKIKSTMGLALNELVNPLRNVPKGCLIATACVLR
jgi:hypothetical protein